MSKISHIKKMDDGSESPRCSTSDAALILKNFSSNASNFTKKTLSEVFCWKYLKIMRTALPWNTY